MLRAAARRNGNMADDPNDDFDAVDVEDDADVDVVDEDFDDELIDDEDELDLSDESLVVVDDEDDDEDDADDADDDEDDDDDDEALDELEAEELEMLTDDESIETLVVDEAAELRAIRRAEIAMEGEVVDGAAADEFVCTSCFLVKKTSQLTNKRKRICRDCAA
jgi:hypothetical protein